MKYLIALVAAGLWAQAPTPSPIAGGAGGGGGGPVTDVTASSPLASSGGSAPNISLSLTNFVQNNQANTYGAFLQNLGAGGLVAPFGSTNPATCIVGQVFFNTAATAGQNWYFCTATNTWTQQLNSGVGTVTNFSVASVPSFLTSSVATATSTPALTLGLASGLTANEVLATPNGTTGPIGLRALVAADIPSLSYQAPITLTTTGTGGAATFISNTLNIPNYTAGSGGLADPGANGIVFRTALNTTAPAVAGTDFISPSITAKQGITSAITSPNVNNVYWVDGFTDTAFPGIGVAQSAYSAGTNYSACTAVSNGGLDYISVTQATNTGNTPASSPTFWWPVQNTASPTQLDCAFYYVLAQAAQIGGPETLMLGNGTFSTPYNTNIGLLEPTTADHVNLIGVGRGFNRVPTSIRATTAMSIMLADPVKSGSFPYNFFLQNINFDANNLAAQCFQIFDEKVGGMQHLGCVNGTVTTTAPWVQIGNTSTGDGYQNIYDDIFVQSNATAASSWGTATVALSGGAPIFTITSAGSYTYNHSNAYLFGYGGSGTSTTPCTSMGTTTATFSGSGPYTLTGLTSSATGCTGTVWVAIPDLPASQFGMEISNISDSTFRNLVVNGVGTSRGIFYNSVSSSKMYDEHIYGGSPVQIFDGHNNTHIGTELDTIVQQGVVSSSAQGVWIGAQIIQPPNPGTIGFFMANGGSITNSTCQNPSAISANGFALAMGSSGPIAHGGNYGNINVIDGWQCDTLTRDSSSATMNLANSTNLPGGSIIGANSIPASTLPLATTGAFGAVKPDGSTIIVSGGVISASGDGSVTIGSTNSSITGGTTGTTFNLQLSSTYLNSLWAQLGAPNTFSAGAVQTFTPSTALEAFRLVGSADPSAPDSGGFWLSSAGDQFNWWDGAQKNTAFWGTGTAPTNGHCLEAGSVAYEIVDAGSACGSGGSTAFSALTGSTNTTAAMVIGTGASLTTSGSGSNTATAVPASGITGTTLASSVITSSLTTVGTIGTGTWAGTTVAVNHGGTGTASTLTGLMRGSSSAMTAAELSGDVTTSGSNAATVVQVEGAAIPVSAAVVSTNSSKQLTASTGHQIVTPLTCADTSASGTAQSCTTTPTFTPGTGDCVIYQTTTANTGAGLTLNVNSLGAKSVAKWQGITTLAANDVLATKPVTACYDGTRWNLASIGNAPSGGGSGTVNSGTQYQMGYYPSSTATISGNSHITTDVNGDLTVSLAATNMQAVSTVTDTTTGNSFSIQPNYNSEVGLVTTQNIVLISTSNSATVQGFQASLSGQGGGSQLQDNGISGVTADDSAGGANIKVTMGGSVSYPIIAKTAAFTMTVVNSTVLANATSAAFTVSLPTAPQTGEIAIIKKTDSSVNAVTVSAGGTIHLDGSTTYSLLTQYKYVQLQFDGTQWWVVANN